MNRAVAADQSRSIDAKDDRQALEDNFLKNLIHGIVHLKLRPEDGLKQTIFLTWPLGYGRMPQPNYLYSSGWRGIIPALESLLMTPPAGKQSFVWRNKIYKILVGMSLTALTVKQST